MTWLADFEFHAPVGCVPTPLCMVAKAYPSGETKRIWLADTPAGKCPITTDSDSLYVAYLASAEIGCHLALGWPIPVNILDLYAEFRLITCGRRTPAGHSLLGALEWFGLGGINVAEKTCMRELAMRGGPFTDEEKQNLMDYCESDVVALSQLFPRMIRQIDLPRALIRGRFMAAVARVERTGIPIDVETLSAVRTNWDDAKQELIQRVDQAYNVFDGAVFKASRWEKWCCNRGIGWPSLPNGKPDLKRETFRKMSRRHPEILPMYELRTTLNDLRLNNLAVGPDGRNRYMLGAFGAKTGRNTPSSTKSIFGPARWIRHFIKPTEGMAIAYIDWCQQELGIAAWLSGDGAMQAVYKSEDPYLAFANLAGAVPAGATKKSHPHERSIYKVCALAVLMGMGPEALGIATNTSTAMGARLLRQHRERFPRFWEWSNNQVDRAMLGEPLQTVFGWRLHPGLDGQTTFRNFALQANGADMMRLAAIAITERGINLCALVHDAVLVEAPTGEIRHVVGEVQKCMAAASRAVLGGFELETDASIIEYPNRFCDERGSKVWNTMLGLLGSHPEPASV